MLKIRLGSYLGATFVGFFFREMFFLILGYIGFSAYDRLLEGINTVESVLTVVMAAAFAALVGWLWYLRRKRHPASWLRFLKK
jgi:membrane protein DedA with SNARE-associated domain